MYMYSKEMYSTIKYLFLDSRICLPEAVVVIGFIVHCNVSHSRYCVCEGGGKYTYDKSSNCGHYCHRVSTISLCFKHLTVFTTTSQERPTAIYKGRAGTHAGPKCTHKTNPQQKLPI